MCPIGNGKLDKEILFLLLAIVCTIWYIVGENVNYISGFQMKRQEKDVKKEERFITEEESVSCQKVADAFTELYENEDIVVLDAGKYGFVELQYYEPQLGFSDVVTYTDSRRLFDDLWEEWLVTQLLDWAAGTPIADMDNEDIFKCLPKEKQNEFIKKRLFFAEKAGIGLTDPEKVFVKRTLDLMG